MRRFTSIKGSVYRNILMAVFLVLVVAVLVQPTAFSMERIQRAAGNSLNGEVVAVENARHLTVLTVQSEEIGPFPNDQLNIFVNPYTTVKICKGTEPARDVKVNKVATITYHEVAGLAVADRVREHC